MDGKFTVDTMIKEIKSNLNKYENQLKTYEITPTKKSNEEIIKLQKTIDDNLQIIQTVVTKEEQKFILLSYKELKEELNKRFKIAQKKLVIKSEKEKLDSLLSEKHYFKNDGNIDALNQENSSLKNIIRMSTEINENGIRANSELDDQSNRLLKTKEQVIKILKKVPVIEQIFGKIKFHRIKEKIIMGCVIGVIAIIGLYLTFYR